MSSFKLSRRSQRHLAECHPILQAVVREALRVTAVDFAVIDGARSTAEQADYVRRGVSKTMDTMHAVHSDGWSWAVDLVPYVPSRGMIHTNKNREEAALWAEVAEAMWNATDTIGCRAMIEWGGDWKWKDLAHWQLRRGLRRHLLLEA